MTCMPRNLASLALLAMAFSAIATPQLVDGNKRLQVGRYTTTEALPQQNLNEPLALVAQLTYPREQVTTVGDAIDYTLLRTGYVLVDPPSLTTDARRFLDLPLPEAQRSLGPFSVQDMLNVLVGTAWRWHADHITRRVWFTLANTPAPRRLEPIVSGKASAAKSPGKE